MPESFPTPFFGRYSLLERLGTGGMAEVFLAEVAGPANFSKQVVVKRLLPELTSDREVVARFLEEARLSAKFSHPNVVQVFELGDVDGDYFIAMEHVTGSDLRRIERLLWPAGAEVPIGIAAAIAGAVCRGLDHVHNLAESGTPLGIVHRDVSPSNVLLSLEGGVKLIDFGVARAHAHARITRHGTAIMGKLVYASPEQVLGLPVTPRSDVFSVGCLLYEALTGVRPFERETEPATLHAITREAAAPPSQLRVAIPKSLEEVVLRALARSPGDRFPTAGHMAQALEGFVAERGQLIGTPQIAGFVRAALEDHDALTVTRMGGESRGPEDKRTSPTPVSAHHSKGVPIEPPSGAPAVPLALAFDDSPERVETAPTQPDRMLVAAPVARAIASAAPAPAEATAAEAAAEAAETAVDPPPPAPERPVARGTADGRGLSEEDKSTVVAKDAQVQALLVSAKSPLEVVATTPARMDGTLAGLGNGAASARIATAAATDSLLSDTVVEKTPGALALSARRDQSPIRAARLAHAVAPAIGSLDEHTEPESTTGDQRPPVHDLAVEAAALGLETDGPLPAFLLAATGSHELPLPATRLPEGPGVLPGGPLDPTLAGAQRPLGARRLLPAALLLVAIGSAAVAAAVVVHVAPGPAASEPAGPGIPMMPAPAAVPSVPTPPAAPIAPPTVPAPPPAEVRPTALQLVAPPAAESPRRSRPGRRQGRLRVTSQPAGAVEVDGVRVAETTPLRGHVLDAGVHRIRVVNERAGRSATISVRIKAGRVVSRHLRLRRNPRLRTTSP